ncbi:hypothetical protein Trco_007001 [Trichoderma cornu-damae]|uniref:Uncharacterized protein n=1 Tax=Trichoderma cornu-damae TaxID=654480 RepID=A0A9P8QHS3_9HYPO|nr:hypothetical protein Trco_007001 [Trichoderma cornu-damae]
MAAPLQVPRPPILCTSALFLSGYAIQQRTLRELRAAIQPRQSPRVHLPQDFIGGLTDLEDGQLILVETEAQRWSREARGVVPQAAVSDAEIQVEETQAEPEPEARREEQKEEEHKEAAVAVEGGKPTEAQLTMLEAIQKSVADKSWAVENPDPLSRNKAPLSRAERRKMIKDEIKRLAQSEKPIYYQRRLW